MYSNNLNIKLDVFRNGNNSRGTENTTRINRPPAGIPILNMNLTSLKTLVNALLAEQQDRNQAFYHVSVFNLDQVAESLMRMATVNFSQTSERMLGN